MVEITMFTDNLAKMGLTPADLAAIGAALTAAALAGIATKAALSKINYTETPEQKIERMKAETEQWKAGFDSATDMTEKVFAGSSTLVKELLVLGSVLPDKVGE